MSRYDNNTLLRDENGLQYLNRTEYPVIPVQDSDLLIIAKFGDSFINLAQTYYNDVNLWWIISRVNNQNNGSIKLKPGQEYRIPTDISLILAEFEELNR